MKRGSEYAAKVKRLFNKLKREYGKPAPVELTDPIEQIICSILTRDTSDSRAQKALASLHAVTVDMNDLRVTNVPDIVEGMGPDYPDTLQRAKDIRAVLQDIFNRESILNLDFLRSRTRRDARQYLSSLKGVDAFTTASVVLWSLGGHAVPVDQQMLDILRKKELVAPRVELPALQAFFEHHISASDAHAFCVLFRRYVVAHAPRSSASTPPATSDTAGKGKTSRNTAALNRKKANPRKASTEIRKRKTSTKKHKTPRSQAQPTKKRTTRAVSRSTSKPSRRKTASRK